MHDIDDDTWAVGRTQCCAHSIRPAAARKCRGTWRLVAADLLYEVAAGGAPRGPPPLPACGARRTVGRYGVAGSTVRPDAYMQAGRRLKNPALLEGPPLNWGVSSCEAGTGAWS